MEYLYQLKYKLKILHFIVQFNSEIIVLQFVRKVTAYPCLFKEIMFLNMKLHKIHNYNKKTQQLATLFV